MREKKLKHFAGSKNWAKLTVILYAIIGDNFRVGPRAKRRACLKAVYTVMLFLLKIIFQRDHEYSL